MIDPPRGKRLVRAGLAFGGLALAAALGWRALSDTDVALLYSGWGVPAAALLHLLAQGWCGTAWHNLVEPPRPSRWRFFCVRWVRASIAALTPVSGVGAAAVAVRLAMRAGLTMETAGASLILDATMEMISQIVFTALGIGLLLTHSPEPRLLGWCAAGLAIAVATVGMFVMAQRSGALRLVESGLSRLARRWPRLSPLSEAKLHNRLMRLHGRRRAASVSALLHLAAWLLGAGEVWVVLLAVGHPVGLDRCVIVESLAMTARSAGFFVPGALGIQEAALALICNLVGLSLETAMLIAVVKRLRDVAVGVPGLLIWQWTEGRWPATGRPSPVDGDD